MDPEARALLWRCRRGMKELDVLLGRYAATVLPQADAGERRVLARLLERPDPELAGYFLGGEVPPEPEIGALVKRITGAASAETVHHRCPRAPLEGA
ncbi:MAG: succinate dehydrogenase assembly factor 2 [Steroidobacteraceae bacterium]